MLTWSRRRVRPACVRVWERASPLTRGPVMNRGCVFASRDLARCGVLQKCGQAAAETASQEPPPASPASQRGGGTPGESLQTSSGRGEDAGSPRERVGARAGGSLSPVRSCRCHFSRGAAGCSGWARAQGGEVALGGRLAFAPGVPGWRAARLPPLPSTPPAASCLRCFLAGIVTSSRPLPQMTAPARALAAPRQFPGPGGGVSPCGKFSAEPLELFMKFLEGQDAEEGTKEMFSLSNCIHFFAIDLFLRDV
ncbi:uncharacterized protein LOC111551840 [Piliocolobus tephrosceles]|uniref:uncharacterized protein LOC111551840 n=1 Tax=Piliocolobus tephrosceles TaxID=591936 RepID=UPI000C29DB0A|nr:uncharacterized protein LOC111551840 [Piliocolobus tephrosceles]